MGTKEKEREGNESNVSSAGQKLGFNGQISFHTLGQLRRDRFLFPLLNAPPKEKEFITWQEYSPVHMSGEGRSAFSHSSFSFLLHCSSNKPVRSRSSCLIPSNSLPTSRRLLCVGDRTGRRASERVRQWIKE